MKKNIIGTSVPRVDAYDKVTGKAKFVDDYFERDMLVSKLVHSPYAHAKVVKVNKEKALALEGVVAVLDYEDTPKILYPTAGHPYSLDPGHLDVADRLIFTNKARYYGDIVAAVVAEDEVIAGRAVELLEIEYEPLDFILDPRESQKQGAPVIHEDRPDNVISRVGGTNGDVQALFKEYPKHFKGTYHTDAVQHAQMEPQSAYAYVDHDGRIVVVSSTQIPHLCRRIVGQALGRPWGDIKVIKPYIGGGFGNKQDVILEPIVAFMTLKCGGRPVKLLMDREEVFVDTRTRHEVYMDVETCLDDDNQLVAIKLDALSNNGAYASHGHSVMMAGTSKIRPLYKWQAFDIKPVTVYTNRPSAGAMRGYGSPQMSFVMESHLDDIATELGVDPVELRMKNFVEEGYEDPITHNVVRSFGVPECMLKGAEYIKWKEKREAYKNQTGHKRRGVGMGLFSYGTGTYPASIELAGARLSMAQDGSFTLMVGATEIGQGADTALLQIAAETIGVTMDKLRIETVQNTDITPFDTAAYASRQTYVSGMAVAKAAREIKQKVINVASRMSSHNKKNLDIIENNIVNVEKNEILFPIDDVALESFYHPVHAEPITADVSKNVRSNAFAYGASFAEIEVDMRTGKIEILDIINVHDSGTIINPKTAEGQVFGGMSMSIGHGLLESMLFNPKTGACYNPNLLDYKLATAMDSPEMKADFVETFEPTSDYGQKALGEPPTLTPAVAIRNAFLHATGVHINEIPLSQQRVFEALDKAGLLQG